MQDRDEHAILKRIDAVRQPGRRMLVAIAGAPGSGKSTLAETLVAAIRSRDGDSAAALLPMDGFHLDNPELAAKGLLSVKGAPETFDVAGFVSLVRRVRGNEGALRYPLFDRAQDRTLPDAGFLGADTQVVVFEGNYLLLQDAAWADLGPMFDVTVMLSVPEAVLRQRLVERWLRYGLAPSEAEARAEGNDIRNARTVIAKSARADLTLGATMSEPAGSRPA
ncbi:uridine kinase [Yoonia sp.]|uniref:uridine kinase n=1 Tax=Yoonia sp. TaxID=2212373 RepID=UPI0019E7EAF7|nr:uridine kinase [Yoonia sp.]MBE0414664.1 uridine kinase [Yoonia sp.]